VSDDSSYDQVNQIIMANGSDPKKLQKDMCFIMKLVVENNILHFEITYSGGCTKHRFELVVWDYFFVTENDIQAKIFLSHDSHGDTCKSIIKKDLNFDLSPLKLEFQKFFQKRSGSTTLLIDGMNVKYEF
jgi:hypothetical protein